MRRRRSHAPSKSNSVIGTITKKQEFLSLADYFLADGTKWTDSSAKWNIGDKVKVTKFIMGTVIVEKA